MRKWLIHRLGGVTKEEAEYVALKEYKETAKDFFDAGCICMLGGLKEKADSLYGISAEKWCEIMYETIRKRLGEVEE